ncbi:MAG: tetratricopeptide repeat protein [Bryobacteraceae bacterium]
MAATAHAWSREEVRRLLPVSERQLRSWQKQQFVVSTDRFGFSDLLALKTLMALRDSRIPAAEIRRTLDAIRARIGDVANPLSEMRLYSDGRRIRVQFEGRRMEAKTGQLLLDFDQTEISRLLSFPGRDRAKETEGAPSPTLGHHVRRAEAELWFERGLQLEQEGAPLDEVISTYQKALTIDPTSAGALVNLGTVYFNARAFREAERYYRDALAADPEYALAHFNLGNLFDEIGDRAKALQHYQTALRLNPNYADAHYNIALLYQCVNQPLKAVRHWKSYLRLDPGSAWTAIARRELGKLRDSTIVPGAKND